VKRINTLLIANRGEIACRVMRAATEMGIRSVAVFVDSDADAVHVGQADESVRVNSYLDSEAILAVARLTGACAVHPGYGFLSENAAFAQAVLDADLIWVGPPPRIIAAMGDKLTAKQLAQDAAVPTLPSRNQVADFASLRFPILIKAVAGGGGKGMRVVERADDLAEAVSSARREALASFGDDRVFAERYVPRARHIEIQILGDKYGNLVHLGERECSIQRRHQKIIEEAPSSFVDEELRAALGVAALRLAELIGYESTGTVEFLVDDNTKEFFFLEVNTRLQVEHPVTEEVTGIDLMKEQLRVAQGEQLGYGSTDITVSGHSIEVRLCSEDPSNDFLPATGVLDIFEPCNDPAVRFETGVKSGSRITAEFDPMFAKVIASAPCRSQASARLALALERLQLGGVPTNRDFLVATLRSPEFLAGDTTTNFIERFALPLKRVLQSDEKHLLGVAATLWLQNDNRVTAPTLASLPSGFRVGRLAPERVDLSIDDTEIALSYAVNRDGSFTLNSSGDTSVALIHSYSQNHIDVEIDTRRRRYAVARSQNKLYLTGASGGVEIEILPRFSAPEPATVGGAIVAPMPGKVVELRVAVGDKVEPHQVVAVLEAMKMENYLRATTSGTVTELLVAMGSQVEKDALLMVIDESSTARI